MSRFGGNGQLGRFCACLGLGGGCLTLANCANGNMSNRVKSNSIAITTTTDAEHAQRQIIGNADGTAIQYVADTNNNNGRATVVGGRPADCPRSFCGCEASHYLFGRVRADLNLASNWMREFPRASPAPGISSAQPSCVCADEPCRRQRLAGDDGNSGHGLTREHVRSISGYIVVNPQTRLTEAMATN